MPLVGVEGDALWEMRLARGSPVALRAIDP
jgi:hypothetical protein